MHSTVIQFQVMLRRLNPGLSAVQGAFGYEREAAGLAQAEEAPLKKFLMSAIQKDAGQLTRAWQQVKEIVV